MMALVGSHFYTLFYSFASSSPSLSLLLAHEWTKWEISSSRTASLHQKNIHYQPISQIRLLPVGTFVVVLTNLMGLYSLFVVSNSARIFSTFAPALFVLFIATTGSRSLDITPDSFFSDPERPVSQETQTALPFIHLSRFLFFAAISCY